MNYIIIDMEWDTVYYKKVSRFINQILQIGAVKLDGSLNVIDTFCINIKSSITKKVSNRFTKLTGITTEDMLSGFSLEDAFSKYNEWAGDNNITLSWSTSDLYSIIDNEQNILKGKRLKLDYYADLQSYIQSVLRAKGYDESNQISLKNAAEQFGINTERFELHTALDDSLISAEILKKAFDAEKFSFFVRDTSNPEFYKRLLFKPNFIRDINSPDIDRKNLVFVCDKCGGETKKTTRWSYKNRWFSSEFVCKECGRKFVGRVSFKKTYDNVLVNRRICECKPKTDKKEKITT